MLFNASSSSSFATSRSNSRTGALQSRTNAVASSSIRVPFALVRGGSDGAGGSHSGAVQLSASSSSVETPTAVTLENLALLSERGKHALNKLMENDVAGHQAHVYSNWPDAGSQDDDKRRLAEQVGPSGLFFAPMILIPFIHDQPLSRSTVSVACSWPTWTVPILEVWHRTSRKHVRC
jgi:hypothetical protein